MVPIVKPEARHNPCQNGDLTMLLPGLADWQLWAGAGVQELPDFDKETARNQGFALSPWFYKLTLATALIVNSESVGPSWDLGMKQTFHSSKGADWESDPFDQHSPQL
eukprot:335015-Pelagomonas_calceolata.AAC.2